MCAAVEIEGPEKAARVYFPVATATLPVLMKNGSVVKVANLTLTFVLEEATDE